MITPISPRRRMSHAACVFERRARRGARSPRSAAIRLSAAHITPSRLAMLDMRQCRVPRRDDGAPDLPRYASATYRVTGSQNILPGGCGRQAVLRARHAIARGSVEAYVGAAVVNSFIAKGRGLRRAEGQRARRAQRHYLCHAFYA